MSISARTQAIEPRSPRGRRLTRPALAARALGVAAVLVSITVSAAFLASQVGFSRGLQAATLESVTASAFIAGDAPASVLLPGGTAELIVRLTNPNPYAVDLVTVVQSGSIAPDPAHAGCAPAGVTVEAQTGLRISLPPGSSFIRFPGAARMDIAAPNACQGATFSVPVAITVQTP